jgi:hypothetical protein
VSTRFVINCRFIKPLVGLANDAGSVLVEAAFSISLLTIIAVGVFQIGLYEWQAMQLEAAVQAGALFATSYVAQYGWYGYILTTDSATNSRAEIQQRVQNALTGVAGSISVPVTNITAQWGCANGTTVDLTGQVCTNSNTTKAPSGCPAVGNYTCAVTGNTPGIYVSITANLSSGSPTVSGIFDLSSLLPYPITRTAVVRIQ